MRSIKYIMAFIAAGVLLMTSCSKEEPAAKGGEEDVMKFSFVHPSGTKVTSDSFEENDTVGLYITNSNAILDAAGNYVTNAPLVYDGAEWSVSPAIYWNNGTYNIYAYYPYMEGVQSVTDAPFSVSTNQSIAENYMKSDFLWALKEGVTASNGEVSVQFAHRLSRMMVKLVKSDDYDGDLPEDAQVFVHNTVTDATVDLAYGFATPLQRASAKIIEAKNLGNNLYAAIVIPQRLATRQPLVEVIMKGVSYLYEAKFNFKPGIQHNVTLVISKNPSQIKIEIGGEIEGWTE